MSEPREFHITKLFVGSDERNIKSAMRSEIKAGYRPHLEGCLYPDGHVYICKGRADFRILLHMYQQQRGPLYDVFEQAYPHGTVPVHLLSGLRQYPGHRVPKAYPVPVDVLWLDYDMHNHKLRVFKDRRQAFETLDEFERRRNDLRPSEIIDLHTSPYQVQFSTDSDVGALTLLEPKHLLA